MPCTTDSDCDPNEGCQQHLPKGNTTCQPVSKDSTEHHCKTHQDCKGRKNNFTICKDDDGKRICAHPDQCLSDCQHNEFCGSKHKCEQLPECTSDEDCSVGMICKVLPTGKNACQPKSTGVKESNIHECGRTSECETKDKMGMICKEDENKIRTCVRPFKCLRRKGCLGNELCNKENECRAPLECSARQKCPSGQTCQEHKPGNPKTCHPDLNLPVPDTLEECDTTQDCKKEGGEDGVCKVGEKGAKGCVLANQCQSKCESNEFCDSEDKCRALKTCRANFDCKASEICKKHKGKKLYTCQSKTDTEYPEMNECGSNKDCEILDKRRTVCKEDKGLKRCVAPEQCLATCSKKEACGVRHKCEAPQFCISSQVCKTKEECKELAPGGLATCQPSPPEPHQCGWGRDCELLGGENTLCMEWGGVRTCVHPDKCRSQCSQWEKCDSRHRCVSPRTCNSNQGCKEGELCKHYAAPPSSDTCQPTYVGPASEEWDECGTNEDCQTKNSEKPVCKDTARGRICVRDEDCISSCSKHELCDLRHRCWAPRSCGSNNDCQQEESCQRHSPDGWKTCHPIPHKDPQKNHQCGSSSDCNAMFAKKTICKEVNGLKICVHPEHCLSTCMAGDVCSSKERCQPSRSCTSTLDCNPNEVCKVYVLGGQKTCQSVNAMPTSLYECGTNADCSRLDNWRPVCKEMEKKRVCVPAEICKSECTASEICNSKDECRTPALCNEQKDCRKNEMCRQFLPIGPKICSLEPGAATKKEHECGTNEDCKNFKDNQSVCKIIRDERKCVTASQCLSNCTETELCDPGHQCQTPTPCSSGRDCKKRETCQQYLPNNPKTCHKDMTESSLEDPDQCGTNEDCEKKNAKKPVCKEYFGKRTCVRQSQCTSQCAKKELCDSNNACRVPLSCKCNKDCKFGETCKIFIPKGKKTCQLEPGTDPQLLQECATNEDCKQTQKEKVVCKNDGLRKTCVLPSQCLLDCKDNEYVNVAMECESPVICRSKMQCKEGEMCRQYTQDGPRTCQSLILVSWTWSWSWSWIIFQHRCGTNKDCDMLDADKPICQESGGQRMCVSREESLCLGKCTEWEICDSSRICRLPKTCKSKQACEPGELCHQYVNNGPKVCHPQDLAKLDECGTNDDCLSRDPRKPVCKESKGKRQCVWQGHCVSKCGKNELCDAEHKCRAPVECNFNADCDRDKGMICKRYSSNGLKTCVFPIDFIGRDQCGTSMECAERNPRKPICKKGIEGKMCVSPEQCFTNCSASAVCTSKHKCEKAPTCRSDGNCKPGKSCMSVVGEKKRLCLAADPAQASDQCASNSDCQAKGTTRTVCKEFDNGHRRCVTPKECLSKCESKEICTTDHKCRATWECKQDKHCAKHEFCRKFVPGGKAFCSVVPGIQEKPLSDECGASLDCKDKGEQTVCKEVDGNQICVQPEMCLDQCTEDELCDAQNQCKPAHRCKSDGDCNENEVCKKITEKGPKTCLLGSGVRPPKFDQCGSTKDCLVKGKDLICKENEGIKVCVNSRECLSKCQIDQLCDLNNECTTPLDCNTDIDCKSNEVCKRYIPGGPKTCIPNPRAPAPRKDQCRTSKDCQSQGKRKICKEEEGMRTCVRPEQCNSKCAMDELCDPQHRCRVPIQCDVHADCDTEKGELCQFSNGFKICVLPVSLLEMDQCGTSKQCKEKNPSKPICKNDGKSKFCVRIDQCLSNCSEMDVCNSTHSCQPLPQCKSDGQCQPWESCQLVSGEDQRTCLTRPLIDDQDQCATNDDCKAKGTVKTVCMEQAGQRKCVEPEVCQSTCSQDEICDQDHRCRAHTECKTNSDCGKAGKGICKKFSLNGIKICVTVPSTEQSEDLVAEAVAEEPKTIECGSNQDCETQGDKSVCKEVGSKKICVTPEQCLGWCNRKEFCNQHHKCKLTFVCNSGDDCKEDEVCRSVVPDGPSTCMRKPGVPLPAIDECGSSLDCLRKDPNTLCKEKQGRKVCVPEDGSSSGCELREYMDSNNVCQEAPQCTSDFDCESNELCLKFIPNGPSVCVFNPWAPAPSKDQCTKNRDCHSHGERTVCKEAEEKRLCVRPEQCKSRCTLDELCDDQHRCREVLQCTANKDCDIEKGEICKTDTATKMKYCVLPLQQLDVNQCETSKECMEKNPKKPVCKEENGKNFCVGVDQCLSNCSDTQVCTSKHKCEDPPKCTSDSQCFPWETCRQISGETQRFCLTADPPTGLDQCTTNEDCKMKGTVRVVCKEHNGRRECVKPELCKSKCSSSERCDEDHRCLAPMECRTDQNCKSNEFCKESGFNGKAFCSLKPESPRPSSDECAGSYDCNNMNGKSVCKDVGGKRICVQPEQCLAKCKKKEFCDTLGQCKPALECKSNVDCKANELCTRIQKNSPKTCILKPGAPPPKFDECGSGKDCASKIPGTICKFKNGAKVCVPSDQCKANCTLEESCDANNMCKSSQKCKSDNDCETGEVCKKYISDGDMICIFNPRSPPEEKDQCSTNQDCKTRGSRTVCKESEGSRHCVKPDKCKSSCRQDEICDESHRCRAPVQCNSNADCDIDKGELCKINQVTGMKLCVPPIALIKVDRCGVSKDCAVKNPSKPVCKESKRGLICVEIEQCFSNCSATQVCTFKQTCEAPPPCSSDSECKPSESCQQLPGEAERACITTNTIVGVDQCATNNDCQIRGTEKTVCKEKNSRRECVRPEMCQSRCSKDEVCDENNMCRVPLKCRFDWNCKSNEICKSLVFDGLKTCVPATSSQPALLDECGANKDCAGKKKRTVCKETGGRRRCVKAEQCFSQCNPDEICDAKQKCQPVHQCSSDKDCRQKEICKKLVPNGVKVCFLKPGVPPPRLDECGVNIDCKKKDPNLICKEEEDGTKVCLPSDQCASNCGSKEVCSSSNNCEPSPGCTSDNDCETDQTCKKFVADGQKTCVFNPSAPPPSNDQCSTNKDCQSKGKRTVCKEGDGKRACVRPDQCNSRCSIEEICNDQHRCRVPLQCKSNADCEKREICKSYASKNTKTCVEFKGRSNIEEVTIEDLCGTSQECKDKNPDKPICKESDQGKLCVRQDQCLSNCSQTAVCTLTHSCKAPPPCKSDGECRPWETCQQIVGGESRVCQTSDPPSDIDQCATNSDCKVKGTVRVVCKQQDGKRLCVRPDACLSKCSSQELCDETNRCRAPIECKEDKDCGVKASEVCRSFVVNGFKSCIAPLNKVKSEECGTGMDCFSKDPTKPICKKGPKGHSICVSPESCLSQCSRGEICTSDHRCWSPFLCQSKSDCGQGESCRQYMTKGTKTCQSNNPTSPILTNTCGTNDDCERKNREEPVCKETASGKRRCVKFEQCLANCSRKALCNSAHKCKALLSCHTDADCDGKDVCKQFSPRGRRTCQNTTGSLELGSDCKVQLGFLIDETCSQKESEILINAIAKEIVGNVQVLAEKINDYLLVTVTDVSFRHERNVNFQLSTKNNEAFLDSLSGIK